MAGLFEVAAQIATPLSLAGIVVIVLFLLYRQLIAGPLAAQLSQSHSFRIVNRLVTYVFILGLLAIVIGIGAFLVVKFLPAPTDALLRGQKHLESLQTGGDSYAFFMLCHFDMQGSFARNFVIIRRGEYPLYDVRIRIRDMDVGRDVLERPWGEINAPADYLIVKWPLAPSVYYRVFFHARNGSWRQDLILKRSDAAQCWLAATRVFDKRGKEVVFEYKDPDFVKDIGAPAWRQ
jgi:hypothetical protein